MENASGKSSLKRNLPLKRKMLILYFSFRDPKTPWYSKLSSLGAIFYLLSPIDIIPDFIPVAGYLDDLVIVPVLLSVASTLLPAEVKFRAEKRAAASAKKLNWTLILFALIVIALLIYIFRNRTER
jgi:uncharacterized membrane protein YkvA (DUF1232 family)